MNELFCNFWFHSMVVITACINGKFVIEKKIGMCNFVFSWMRLSLTDTAPHRGNCRQRKIEVNRFILSVISDLFFT